ncbi:MAG: hypothetical protein WB800_32240, partial [Streptosporangiaceae bacterium]
MIEAFQEQLITIDELRARMPALRARETNLRGQAAALDTQLADRDAYLKLADDLEGFLAQLRGNSHDASTTERQRVLRLLVKDVLIGPEKVTIRHRIPIRERTTGDKEPTSADTEGDHAASYPLRWGRAEPPVRCSVDPVPADPGAVHGAVDDVAEQPAARLDHGSRADVAVFASHQHPVNPDGVGDDETLPQDLGRVAAPPVRGKDAVADVAALSL